MSQEAQQELLRQAWLEGRSGNLNALGEAKAWALREAWRTLHDNDWGLLPFVAARVSKSGTGDHPSTSALFQLFTKMDGDEEWFPGKSYQEKHGPDKALNGTCMQAIATSAMATKKRRIEPTYKYMVGACEKAVINPNTGNPVDKKIIYEIFRTMCYDEDPKKPWKHKARYSKAALPEAMMARRLSFGKHIQALNLPADWFFRNIIWVDICNSILPLSETKASDQALSRKGKKGWGSPGCELDTCNLRGNKESEKQNSWDTMKVWWAPILSKGKLHIEILDSNFPGENSAGAAVLVAKTRAAINIRFQGHASAPTVIWTDRGKGFYSNLTGQITRKYKAALTEHGFRAMMGEDGSVQPGRLQELMLHETAVSWIRLRLTRSVPKRPWEESRDAYAARLKACAEDINRNLRLDDLCNAFPKRIETLVNRDGGRLRW